MKYSNIFKDKLDCANADEVFDYLLNTLKISITKWDYFVNWSKALSNLRDVEICLNTLNYLVGKNDIEKEAEYLITEHPKILKVIPGLLACRDKKFNILDDYVSGEFKYDNYDFSNKKPSKEQIKAAVKFLKNSGFLEQISSKNIKSISDYFFGVEVGLDSNGRKNRGGTAMEDIVEFFVAKICKENGLEYMTQATAPKIKAKWNKSITVEKSSKQIDFAINTPNKLFLIETNFYGGVGSKLKSTAGEYTDIFKQWANDGHQFIWITDGMGWTKSSRPLRDTFDKTDYILNLEMIQKGILEAIVL